MSQTTFGSLADASDAVIDDAVAWYQKTRMPVAFREAHPKAREIAEKACEGDWRRCVLNDDWSITIYNRPRW